ncbi:hypothetical protein PoB_003790500 [Plakobranchus ocellatus]|uniref:Uncharacterized protein n=1 Tax=Plakobranchus ocellatus TaxID=259542 RepID=A0AAV4AX31_9GAST|nr:hypothetical protein PoB_003790500 [Plakobranchus ocellatus]
MWGQWMRRLVLNFPTSTNQSIIQTSGVRGGSGGLSGRAVGYQVRGRGADGGARNRDRRVPEDLRAESLTTVPPMSPDSREEDRK